MATNAEIRYRLPQVRFAQHAEAAKPELPRITRLMALAIKFDALLRQEPNLTISDLAALGHVTPSRVQQILNLLGLAPDIQERILFLTPVAHGREPVTEAKLRHLALMWDWTEQRRAVEQLLAPNRLDDKAGRKTARPLCCSNS